MSDRTAIPWAEATWNPFRGCDKVSQGCKFCYAERIMVEHEEPFEFKFYPERLQIPGNWRTPRKIFVCSMSDLFHEQATDEQIKAIWDIMLVNRQHVYMILTKRVNRLWRMAEWLEWPYHIWAGVSIESSRYVSRADDLRQVPARVKFISAEPLLGSLRHDLSLDRIDWVIAGKESGWFARDCDMQWVLELRDMTFEANIPFFLKEWRSRASGHPWDYTLEGVAYRDSPPMYDYAQGSLF